MNVRSPKFSGGTFTSIILIGALLANSQPVVSQEAPAVAVYEVPFQNLLKFNRFLINPTFSQVREDKSYINFFHRNQSAVFNDNAHNYFLSYSNRLNERTGFGISAYSQQQGVISNLGFMANYAYGVRLGSKSDLSFGFNLPYYMSRFDQSRAVITEEDPFLNELTQSSILSFQPGLNLSVGKFDFGVFAQNLVDYNFETGKSITALEDKIFSGHVQFVHEFKKGRGIFEDGRLMPLARARIEGTQKPVFGGGLIMDLPKLGWIQGGYDEFYGASAGTGFNLNQNLSLGYNFEKALNNELNNLGVTHEVSIAYSFTPRLTRNVMKDPDQPLHVVENTNTAPEKKVGKGRMAVMEQQIDALIELQKENYAVINELIFKVDSLEQHQERDLERRFESVVRVVRRENQMKDPINIKVSKTLLAENDSEKQLKATDKDERFDAKALNKSLGIASNTRKPKKGFFVGGASTIIKKKITLVGIEKGHYLIANVFQNEAYLKRFLGKLEEMGLKGGYFKNPENGLNYVYLAKYEDGAEAELAYHDQMGGAYKDDMWVMHVNNPHSIPKWPKPNLRITIDCGSPYSLEMILEMALAPGSSLFFSSLTMAA